MLWFVYYGRLEPEFYLSPAQAIGVGSSLAFVELLGGDLDNFLLPAALSLFLVPSRAVLALVLACVAVGTYLYYSVVAAREAKQEAFRLYKAYFWFTRPHTIVGTSLGVVTVSMVSLYNNFYRLNQAQVMRFRGAHGG